jgi:hypothetical protein
LSGGALLAVGTGVFLLRRWRTAPDTQSFHDSGDVQFALAVFLLVLIALLMLAVESAPAPALLIPAVIPLRKFVTSLRRSG